VEWVHINFQDNAPIYNMIEVYSLHKREGRKRGRGREGGGRGEKGGREEGRGKREREVYAVRKWKG
jgi:hypothetical protein